VVGTLVAIEPVAQRRHTRSLLPQVWVMAALGCVVRLLWAATSYGTNDVGYFATFIAGAHQRGPVGVYGISFTEALYNHGPLTSWFLYGAGSLVDRGVGVPFLIRVPACLADLVSPVLVFALVRGARGERVAACTAGIFSAAPLALIVAGFHGNTDPVLVCLVLLSVWCVVERGAGASAGLAFGLAVSMKIVPVVALPALCVLARRHGNGALSRFLASGAAVFAVLWVPVLVAEPRPFFSHVLGYKGAAVWPQWGLPELAHLLGAGWPAVLAHGSQLRFLPVLMAASLPAWLAVRARDRAALISAACLPLPVLLVLLPTFSMQYLVWSLAPILVATPLRNALSYAVSSSGFALLVYSGWSGGGPPWAWGEAHATLLPDVAVPLMFLAWLTLTVCCAVSIRALLRPPTEGPAS
jgi:hypothetical protein